MSKKEALLSFIEGYRDLPESWDQRSPAYSNRVKKAAAYDVLIEKLKTMEPDATRDSVVNKINNLRSTFRKELKKVNDSKRSGTGADDVYVPSLWYFNDLMFLVDQETPDPSESTFDINRSEDSVPISSSESTLGSSQTSFSVPSSKKRKIDPTSASQDLLLKATRYLEAEDDEFLTLAKGYAVKLRKLSPQQLMFADKVINDTLLDAQMGLLTRQSYVVHQSESPSSIPPSPSLSSHSWAIQPPSNSSSQSQTARHFVEEFSYCVDDDDVVDL